MGGRHRRRVPPDHDHPGAHLSRRADRPSTQGNSETRAGASPGPRVEHAQTSDRHRSGHQDQRERRSAFVMKRPRLALGDGQRPARHQRRLAHRLQVRPMPPGA
jgi:hypothetical protein